MNEDEKIDRHLRDRLKDQEHPVSDRVWTNIKSSLPPENSNRGGLIWKNWLTASVIVATTMALIYYWNTNQEVSNNTVSSGNTIRNTPQTSPAASYTSDERSLTIEKNSSEVSSTQLSTAYSPEKTANDFYNVPQKSKVRATNANEKNTIQNNVVSRNNPSDKYSIAYNYVAQHPDPSAPVLQNISSPSVKTDVAPVVTENTYSNKGVNIPTETNTSEQTVSNSVTTYDKNPTVNTFIGNTNVVNENPQNITTNNTSETTSGNIPVAENTSSENSPVSMNKQENTPSVFNNDKDATDKTNKEEKNKEEKQNDKEIKEKKEKKDKDQEKEKSILPKPVFSADAYIMPAYTGVTTSSNTNDASYKNQIAHKNAHDRTWVTLSYGGRFNYHMTDAIEFSTGLHYQKIEERISATRSIDTITDGISAQSRYTMIAIPLGAAYNFNAGKLRIRLGAACNLQYTLTSKTYFYNDHKDDLEAYTYDAKGMNLALQFSGALIYPITQHVNFLMEPTLQYNLDDLNHSTMFFKEKPYLIGLKTGVRIAF